MNDGPATPPPRPVTMPDERFNEIAAQLFAYASRAARAVEDGRVIAARGQAGLGVERFLEELQREALTAGRVYQMFRDLAPYEDEVRAFIASLGNR